jgi:hypothetical protein
MQLKTFFKAPCVLIEWKSGHIDSALRHALLIVELTTTLQTKNIIEYVLPHIPP